MVIQSNSSIGANANTAGKAKQSTSAPSPNNALVPSKPGSDSSKDSVSLSPEAQSIAKIETNISRAPEVDTGKIAEVKAAIASGSYKIDSDAIAKQMMDEDTYF